MFASKMANRSAIKTGGSEKWPQRHKDTKQNCLLKFIFVFWCLGGENVLPQNAKKI
jgi:hypothetical protein